jgi:WxL domain surface cell wall-binding
MNRPAQKRIAISMVSTVVNRALLLAGFAALLLPASAVAATATATLSAGSLAFVSTPPNVSFSATLNGTDQTVTSAQALDVGDATGSGAGWNLTATSTTFTTGGGTPHTLSTSATTVGASPTVACDTGVTCVLATNSVSYPYTLPAASTAPVATKVFNAAANTGMGNQTVTPSWKLAVPASTLAGTYTSTWTISLVSGP